MKFARRRACAYVCALATILTTQSLWATQPAPVEVTVDVRYSRTGASLLHLVNRGRETYRIAFSPGPAGTVTFRPLIATVEPGATIDLSLGQLPFSDGVQIFDLNSSVSATSADQKATAEGQVLVGPTLYDVLVVDPTSVRVTTYTDQFLARRIPIRGESKPAAVDFGGGYTSVRPIGAMAFESAALDPSTPFTSVDLPSPVEMSDMKLKQLPDFGSAGAEGGDTGAQTRAQADRILPGHRPEAPTAGPSNAPFGSIQGKLFLKVPAAGNTFAFNAAWGWSARAWQQIGSTWIQIGSTFVAGDGSWTINYLFFPFPGFKVRVEYQPANRFIQVQDENDNVYTWGDNWNTTGTTTDIGWRSINLSKTGDAPGIDVIYQGGTALWRRFKADGMNALRDEPIQITFPNTSLSTCPQVDSIGNPIPWSCSDSQNGHIWLISKHAKAGVVQHESAHSIHSFYWDGNMPSGSGIQHSLKGCFNPGLALTEGFADFIPYWVQFDRNNPGPQEASLGYNIETPGSGFCNGASNETHVSATFWDVYDTHNDGASPKIDTWNFFHHGAAVGTFLNNPGHNSMQEYWLVYTAILGPTWNNAILQTFVLNTMF